MIAKAGSSPLRLLYDHDELAAEGHDVIVPFNYCKGAKEFIPDGLRRPVESLEGRAFPDTTSARNP